MGKQELRVIDAPEQEAFVPAAWFAPAVTPEGLGRLWRFIPAEAFAQLKHFEAVGVAVATLGDVPPADEGARWEMCKFLGRSLIHLDRVVHQFQGEVGPLKIAVWTDEEILRLVKEAAIFHGLRVA